MAEEDTTPFDNNLFSNHFLEERLNSLEEWEEAEIEEEFEQLRELWEQKKDYLRNDPNEDNTQEQFINKVLNILGHYFDLEAHKTVSGKDLNPDYLFFDNFNKHLEAEEDGDKDKFQHSYAVGDAKRWGRKLDKSSNDHTNPAFQIYNYVDRLRVPWGILTNGKKWRLYSYKDCEADTYYEIDIVEKILEEEREQALQNFKYFYLFFRQESFLPSEEAFIDQVLEGSISYAKELEEDLEDKIYTALEVTARGFFEANDIEKTEENIEKVHRASLIFLYRFLFILNAESRELLPVDHRKYKRILSLEHLKEALDDGDENAFGEDAWVWNRRIKPLFDAINSGEEYGDFKITAYNGGLFDEEEHPFLDSHELHGRHIRKVMKLLAQSEDEETGEKVLVDYRDLNIRHLGSVYEGLLEHELAEAEENLILENGEWTPEEDAKKDFSEVESEKKVEEGQVYITNESGERKATGSYYTPEYIVEYIVENTVGPKVDEKVEDADEDEVLEEVLDLNICDPAMGSGHFLTEATSYIARRVMEEGSLEDEDIEEENEFVWVKRQVVQSCIYGVDINPLATELAKLSLWIETMAEGKPLGFLDHHLKVGNSLVGADLDEIVFHPDAQREEEDLSNFNVMIEDMKEGLRAKYRKIEQMPETTVEEVHEKEEEYREFKEDNTYYQSVNEFCNLYTYQLFEGDISPEQYGRVRDGIHNMSDFRNKKWFKEAQDDAEQRNYFHWALEFPKIFFGEEKGFDAVVGNPPYYSMEGDELQEVFREMYSEIFTGDNDISHFFMVLGTQLTSEKGIMSYIITRYWLESTNSDKLRGYLSSEADIREIIDFRSLNVWSDVGVNTAIITFGESEGKSFRLALADDSYDNANSFLRRVEQDQDFSEIQKDLLDSEEWYLRAFKHYDLWEKIKENDKIETIAEFTQGIKTGKNPIFLVDEATIEEYNLEREPLLPVSKSKQVKRYRNESDKYLIYAHEEFSPEDYPNIMEYLEENRTELESRAEAGDRFEWWRLQRPRDKDLILEGERVLTPYFSTENSFAHCYEPVAGISDVYMFFIEDEDYTVGSIAAILNSKLMNKYYSIFTKEKGGKVLAYSGDKIGDIPIPEISEDNKEKLGSKADTIKENYKTLERLNLDIRDYVNSYQNGDSLGDKYTPPSGLNERIISQTSEEKENLQVGNVATKKRGSSVTLKMSARYKPEDESQHETDQYGYTETELYPAMEFHDLSDMEAALIEEFVPVAIEEAGGFANFRKKATKTKSLIDRLKELTLPKLDDVEDDLRKFVEQKKKAEDLEQKIQETDEEINQIVYDLYDLSEEEIEVVEESIS